VAGSKQKPTSSATAKPGDNVVFVTKVPAARPGKPATVTLSLPNGPNQTLTIKAKIKGHSTTATLNGAGGKPLTLLRLHYHCYLPPAPGFCPPLGATAGSKGTKLKAKVKHGVTVAVEATVGPVTLPPSKLKTPGVNVAPAYRITELLRAIAPGSSTKPPAATSSVTARPKDIVQMLTRVGGRIKGAKQPVTISFQQGPATSLTVLASIPGGATSTATIKSASSSKITLVVPFYTCYLPPNPTFCPVTKTSTASHRYTVTIPAAPGTSAPLILGTVGAG
jgi:hypothetical protein